VSTGSPNLEAELPALPAVTGQPCEGCGAPTQYADLKHPIGMTGTKRLLCPKCLKSARDQHSEKSVQRAVKARSTKAVSRTRRVIALAGSINEVDSPNPAILFNAMTDEAGGLERIAAIWWETIEGLYEDQQRGPLLKQLNNFAKLLVAASPKVEESINYRELSDEELALQQQITAERAFALRLIEKHPELKASIEEALTALPAPEEEDTPEEEDDFLDEDEEDGDDD